MMTVITIAALVWVCSIVFKGIEAQKVKVLISNTSIFDTTKIVPPSIAPPTPKGEWKSIISDHKALKEYAKYLDDHKAAVEDISEKAINHFQSDQAMLVKQQKQVIKIALSSRSSLKRFEELELQDANKFLASKVVKLELPKVPEYKTAKQFAREYSLVPGYIGSEIGRLISSGGQAGSHPLAALVMIAVSSAVAAVQAKEKISKAVRALEDGYSIISRFCINLNTTVELLGRAHKELVKSSQRLNEAKEEIESLSQKVSNIPADLLKIAELTEEDRESVQNLYYWTLAALQFSKEAV
jgi:hypothetical protein